jgi:hypothetical protein
VFPNNICLNQKEFLCLKFLSSSLLSLLRHDSTNYNFESNKTPSTLILFIVCNIESPNLIFIEAVSCWYKQRSLLSWLTLSIDFLSHLVIQCHCYNFVHEVILRQWDTILEALFHFLFCNSEKISLCIKW